jgi:hypothetical protein
VAVQSPETTQGRDARSTVAEMESQETAGSTGVNSYVACLMLLRVSDAGRSQRCGLHRGRRPKAVNEDAMGRASARILIRRR